MSDHIKSNALLSAYDTGRECGTAGLDDGAAVRAFEAGLRDGRRWPLDWEIGLRAWPAGKSMARRVVRRRPWAFWTILAKGELA